MLYDVEQVSVKLNVSKQAIYSKLKMKDYKDRTLIKQGKTYIDEELFKLIQDNIKVKSILNNYDNIKLQEDVGDAEKAQDTILYDDLVNMNKDLIKTLIEQLKVKDVQIQELQIQIHELNERLKQEQKLVENSQILLRDKPQNIEALEEHFIEFDSKLINIQEQMEQRKEQYKQTQKATGFFSKIFKR